MCPKRRFTRIENNLCSSSELEVEGQKAWRQLRTGAASLMLQVTLLASSTVSVQHPELSVYPVFAA
jgi:hypothetical protein